MYRLMPDTLPEVVNPPALAWPLREDDEEGTKESYSPPVE